MGDVPTVDLGFVYEMTTRLETLLSGSLRVPRLLFVIFEFLGRPEDPRNSFVQNRVECRATIGPEGENWTGLFREYVHPLYKTQVEHLTGSFGGIPGTRPSAV